MESSPLSNFYRIGPTRECGVRVLKNPALNRTALPPRVRTCAGSRSALKPHSALIAPREGDARASRATAKILFTIACEREPRALEGRATRDRRPCALLRGPARARAREALAISTAWGAADHFRRPLFSCALLRITLWRKSSA